MASQKLLVVLVMKVFNDQQTSNIIDQSVFNSGVEVDSVLVFTIVTN